MSGPSTGFEKGLSLKTGRNGGVLTGFEKGRPKKRGGGGGFLSDLEAPFRWIGAKASLAGHDLEAMPGGLWELDKALANDLVRATGGPHGAPSWLLPHPKGGYQSPGVLRAFGHQIAETAHHPLRDPFQTALLAAPAIGAAGKAGEAGVAARAAEGGAAAKLAAGTAKLFEHGVAGEPRLLRMGDGEFNLAPPSRNAAMRLAQRGYDRALQNALDTNPEGRLAAHASRRIGAQINEAMRPVWKIKGSVADELEHAGLRAGAGKIRRAAGSVKLPRPVTEAALRLWIENSTPEEALRLAESQAAKGVGKAANLKLAKLYRQVIDHRLLLSDAAGVHPNAELHPAFGHLVDVAREAVGRNRTLVAKYDLMTPEGAAAREAAPGQLRRGGEFVKQTAADVENPERLLGRSVTAISRTKSGGAFEMPAKVEKIDAEAGTARVRFFKKNGGSFVKEVPLSDVHTGSGRFEGGNPIGAMSDAELQAKLDRTDKFYEQLVDRLVSDKPYKRVTAYQNAMSKKLGRKGLAYKPQSVVARDVAETRLLKLLEEHPEIPQIAEFRAELDQAAAIRQELAARNDPFGVETHVPNVAPKPRGFVTYASEQTKPAGSAAARTWGKVVGKPKNPIPASKHFEGTNPLEGRIPDNTSGLVARHLRLLQRFENTHLLRQEWLRTGSNVGRSERDILVRDPGSPAADIPAEINHLLGRSESTLDELATDAGSQLAFDEFKDSLLGKNDPEVAHLEADPAKIAGTPAPDGYKWVDKGVLGDFGNSFMGSAGKPARIFNSINSGVTALTVYFKIGHLGTRLLTDASTNITEGSALFAPRSYAIWRKLSWRERARAFYASGQHGYNALPHEGTNWVGRTATKGANFWAHRIDAPFRFNAIVYEADRAGFKGANGFKAFLQKTQHLEDLPAKERARVENVMKSANRENISYDRLNDIERRYIARGIWFYPWVKGSTMWTGRFIVEHPYKAGVVGLAAATERERQAGILGDLPSYEFGLVPLGGPDAQGNIDTTNLGTFTPMATPASLLQIPEYGNVTGNLNPAAAALLQLALRQNQYGQHSNNPLGDAATSLLGPTPEFQTGLAGFGGRHSKMFPESNNVESQLLRMLFGPAFPRKVSPDVLHKSFGYEQTGR